MIRTKYYLDKRAVKGGSPAPLKLAIHKRGAGAYVPTGIRLLPAQWDACAQKVVKHPHRDSLNSFLSQFRVRVDSVIRDLILSGEAAPMTATAVKNAVSSSLLDRRDPVTTFGEVWAEAIAKYEPGTLSLFSATRNAIECYDPSAMSSDIRAIDSRWLDGYIASRPVAPNTVRSEMSRIRRVLNLAVSRGYISSSPSPTILPPPEATRHRNLSAEQMRLFLTAPCLSETEALVLDFFSLSFYLCAINPADLFTLSQSCIHNGRVEYVRKKTGKPYSVRLWPEALEIIARRTDGVSLFGHPYRNGRSFVTAIQGSLHSRSTRLGLPQMSMYWARHTFASIAFDLGFSMDRVSASLGHALGGARVTSVYVSIQDHQVDEVARAVYDAVK